MLCHDPRCAAEDLGLPAHEAQILKGDLGLVLEPLREAIRAGGNLKWRLEELREEAPWSFDLLAATRMDEALELVVRGALRNHGVARADVLVDLHTHAEQLRERLSAYQRALFRAAVATERMQKDGCDLTGWKERGELDLVFPILEAAFELPFWTIDEALLGRAAAIDECVDLFEGIRREAAQSVLADLIARRSRAPS